MCKLLSSRDYDGLDIRCKLTVGVSNRTFGFKVYHIPDATYDMMYAEFVACINRKVIIINDGYTFEAFSSLSYDIHLFLEREESPLVYIDTHSHDDFIKHCQRPLQDIEMTCCERIE